MYLYKVFSIDISFSCLMGFSGQYQFLILDYSWIDSSHSMLLLLSKEIFPDMMVTEDIHQYSPFKVWN